MIICYDTWSSYSIFGENELLTPNDPIDIVPFEEGVKLNHIHKSRDHAT